MVIALAVTRDGVPVRSWIFSGNTPDLPTVQTIKNDLRAMRLGRVLFVGDAGLYVRANLNELNHGAGRYILATPIGRVKEIRDEVLSHPGRYANITPTLRAKEVVEPRRVSRRPQPLRGWSHGKPDDEPLFPGGARPRGPDGVRAQASIASQWAAIKSIAGKIGCTARDAAEWVRQAERDQGLRAGLTTEERERIKALERENRELRQANEILRKASAYFAQAELDRRVRSDDRVHRRSP